MADGNEFVRRLLTERRMRLVGSILGEAEKTLFPHVPQHVQKEYRQKVLEFVGSYHDVALDCMKASVDDGTRNDPAEIIAALRPELRAIVREVQRGG